MARTGLYKSDVKGARDSLLAQSIYPSADAVRAKLGNTGSKTTIHKYLKELEEDEGDDARKTTLNDALLDLVERLAAGLRDDADARLAVIAEEFAARENIHSGVERQLTQEVVDAMARAGHLEAALESETLAHAATRQALQAEAIAHHTAEQQVSDLKERLAENEGHRASLEDKHDHARQALDHYRQASKEQREQEQRRHEHQVQQVQAELRLAQHAAAAKQEDVTRLNQEGTKLVADLSHARLAVYEAQRIGREQATKLEQASIFEQKLFAQQEKCADKDAQIAELSRQLQAVSADGERLTAKMHELEIALAAARAISDGQHGLAAELRRMLDGYAGAAKSKVSQDPAQIKSS